MFTDFIQGQLPDWAQVVPGREKEALLATVETVSRQELLDDVLSGINHPEYVFVEATLFGDSFILTAEYVRRKFEAEVRIEGVELVYTRFWGEVAY